MVTVLYKTVLNHNDFKSGFLSGVGNLEYKRLQVPFYKLKKRGVIKPDGKSLLLSMNGLSLQYSL